VEFEVESVAIRTMDGGDGRTIEGIAVPYGQSVRGMTREYGSAEEQFAPGAFDDVIAVVNRGKRIPISDKHAREGFGAAVGYVDHLENSPEGLRYSGRLFKSQRAADFAERVTERVQGVSIEFLPGEVKRTAKGVVHTRAKELLALAGSYAPAFAGATAAVRSVEGSRVSENETPAPEPEPTPPPAPVKVDTGQMSVIAQQITDEAIRKYAAQNSFSGAGPVDLFADYRGKTFGELAETAMQPGAERTDREWMQRAIRTFADTVTTSSANAGMVTPGVVGDVHGIVSRGRPAITAFGGPRPVPDVSGMSIDWPYYDGTLTAAVGAQSAEKAEITSVAMNIKKGTEALATYAGGSDVSFQLLRRSTRNYLDVYFRILLTAWGVVTDAAFVTELESGSVTSDMGEALASVDATEFKNLVVDASIAVETATGQPADFVLASTTAFAQFAKLFTPITTLYNTGLGTLDLRNLTVAVGGLPLIHVPSITAGKLIVSNREAAAWYEDGPFQVQDTDVIHLGQNVAIWSMGAGARFIPAGIIEMYDVSP
jgi:hypothetical protein